MQKIIMLITGLILAGQTFAAATFADAQKSAWRAEKPVKLEVGQHDLNMVYGGADIRQHFMSNTITG